MTIDVIDLRDFYSQRLGIVARRLINRGIHARWPDAAGQRVLGLGYPTPYLGLFREDSERCIAFMPAAQGVLKWPTARPTLATLVDEFSLPLPDAAVDRILLVHALEMSDDPEGLLREVWRLLAPSGSHDGGYYDLEPARGLDPYRHHPVRPRPAVFAFTDHTIAAADLVHADRMGRGAVHAAGSRRLVPAPQPWHGSKSVRRWCRCRSPAFTSWKPPNRSIVRSRRIAERTRLIPALPPVLVPSSLRPENMRLSHGASQNTQQR